jgi:hypothetical protein
MCELVTQVKTARKIVNLRRIVSCALLLVLIGCDSDPASFPLYSPATELQSPAGTDTTVPYLSTNGDNTVLSWIQKGKQTDTLFYARLEQGRWAVQKKAASGPHWFVNWADVPAVAADAEGNLLASYLVKSGSRTYGYNLNLVVSSDRGRSWTRPFVPHDDRTQTEHGFVSLLPIGQGQFFIAWLDGRNNTWGSRRSGGSMGLRGVFVDNRGTLTHEGPIDLRVCDCCQPSAVNTAHGPAVLYRDRSGEEIRDIAIAWWEHGAWTGPFPVAVDNWRIEGCPVDGPKADTEGDTLAGVWFTASRDLPRVNLAFSGDNGKSFAKPIRVDDGNAVGRADVVLLDQHTALVSWLESLGDHGEIRMRRVSKDGTTEESRGISGMSLSRSSGFPQMSAHDGKVYFAWSEGKRIRTAVVQP